MPEKKNILLCAVGFTPQIITETLWALAQRPSERVDEVRVITTLEGGRKIHEKLLAEPCGQFHRFCCDFQEFCFERPLGGKIRFDENCLYLLTKKKTGVPSPRDAEEDRLSDILTEEDNQRAANQICDVVHELTQDQEVRVHATVAGGRKTMGIYLTAAMQMFGRHDDALSHVLVSPEVEGHPDFYYVTPEPEPLKGRDGLTTHDGRIYLADIPFVRLRGLGMSLLKETGSRYDELVGFAQGRLRLLESANRLRFDMAGKRAIFGTLETRLSERLLFVYVLFAHLRKTGCGAAGFVSYDEITRQDLDAVCRIISKARGEEVGFEDYPSLPRCDFIRRLDTQTVLAELLNKPSTRRPNESAALGVARADIVKDLREIRSKINAELVKNDWPPEFLITEHGGKFERTYGLPIEPERIELNRDPDNPLHSGNLIARATPIRAGRKR